MTPEQLNVAKELTLAAMTKLDDKVTSAGGTGTKFNEYIASEVSKMFKEISKAVVEASGY